MSVILLGITSSLLAQTPSFNWVNKIGGTGTEAGYGLTMDDNGNTIVVGNFEGVVDFDPGAGTTELTSSASSDGFIAKYDPSGNFLWVRQIAGSDQEDVRAVAVDASGNVYVGGMFWGTTDLDPSAGTQMVTGQGYWDLFVLKLNAQGDFQWANAYQGAGVDNLSEILVDGSGNVFVCGAFGYTMDFDAGAGTQSLSSINNSLDAFLLKINSSNGGFQWVKRTESNGVDGLTGMCFDLGGDILLCGSFYFSMDVDPSLSSSMLTSNGGTDIFVVHYGASAGDLIWGKSIGGVNFESAEDIAIDGSGNFFVTGAFGSAMDFDPGVGAVTYTPFTNSSDMYLFKWDITGNYVWANHFVSNQQVYAQGNNLAVDVDGDVYISGFFEKTVDFDPTASTFQLTGSSNSRDIFVGKYSSAGLLQWAYNFGSNYSEFGQGIWVNDQEEVFITGSFGSVVDFDPDGTSTFNVTGNGSNDAFLLKLGNCLPDATTDVQLACGSYDWIDGNTYTSSTTTPTFTYSNEAGCDSVVTLNLTIFPTFTVNISNAGNVLSASVAGATSYQWIDCNTSSPIAGANSQSFSPTQNGSYAVEVYNNNCSVLSACENFTTIGMHDLEENHVKLFPNPAHSNIQVSFEQPTAFSVWSVNGQHIANYPVSSTTTIDLAGYAPGVYYIQSEAGMFRFIVH